MNIILWLKERRHDSVAEDTTMDHIVNKRYTDFGSLGGRKRGSRVLALQPIEMQFGISRHGKFKCYLEEASTPPKIFAESISISQDTYKRQQEREKPNHMDCTR